MTDAKENSAINIILGIPSIVNSVSFITLHRHYSGAHDRTRSGKERLLHLRETLGLSGKVPRAHIVSSGEGVGNRSITRAWLALP